MTDVLIEASQVEIQALQATPIVATLEVTAGIGGPQGPEGSVPLALTIRGVLGTGVGLVPFPLPFSKTVVHTYVAVADAPVGADLIFDVMKNGVSIYPTAPKPTILAGQRVSAAAIPDVTALAAGDVLTVDVVQVGSTQPGSYATVVIVVQ